MNPRQDITHLREIPNVGPATIRYLSWVGITTPFELIGQDPIALYTELCSVANKRFDPCLADVFISAVKFMEGAPKKGWWDYTELRKRILEKRAE